MMKESQQNIERLAGGVTSTWIYWAGIAITHITLKV